MISMVIGCELCYESIDSLKCYDCAFIQNCRNCSNCWFCYDCIGSKDCFGSVNLRSKQHCWFNEQLTKEEYQKRLTDFQSGSYSSLEEMKRKFVEFRKSQIHKSSYNTNVENVIGDRVTNSKNVYMGYDCDTFGRLCVCCWCRAWE